MKQLTTLVVFYLLMSTQLLADIIDLRFFNPQINGNQYCVTIQIISQDVTFNIGISTIYFYYDYTVINNPTANPINFSAAPCNGTPNSYTNSFSFLETPPALGEINYSILTFGSICPDVTTTEWIDVVEFCFDIVDATQIAGLVFNTQETGFSMGTNNGVIQNGTFINNTTASSTVLNACNDGLQNGLESNVDCGGFHCYACVAANYTASALNICIGETVNFTDSSLNNDTWSWDFGGLGTSTMQNPSFTFNTAGSYMVELTADNSGHSDTFQQTVTVNNLPVANAGLDETLCIGSSVALTATGGTDYVWDNGGSTASVTVSPSTTTTYTVTVTDANSCSATDEVVINVETCPVVVQVKVYLEGSYNNTTGLMNTSINSLLPNNQPFNTFPWFYNDNGEESNVTIPSNMVDWVLLELRDGSNSNSIVEQKAAFLYDDGTVRDVDGITSGVHFNIPTNGNSYYVIVRSRNHLDVLSNNLMTISNNTGAYNFSIAVSQAEGSGQQVQVSVTTAALHTGDVDANGVITLNDYNKYEDQLNNGGTISIYRIGDTNLDGNITISDFNRYQPNASIIGIREIRY